MEKDSRFINVKNDTTKTPTSFPKDTRFKHGNIPWNKDISLKILLTDDERKKYGRSISIDEIENLKTKHKNIWDNNEERKKIWKERSSVQYADPIKKQYHQDKCISHKDKIWITDGYYNKRILEKDFNKYPGWRKGRFIPRETVNKMTAGRMKKG